MATHSTLIYNPTNAPVTVDGNTVPANGSATFALVDTTTDAYFWLDAGCVLTKPAGTNGTTKTVPNNAPGTVGCTVCGFNSTPGSRVPS